ncbi:MAG: hypothetical protein K2H09_07935 [Treponemataceae bacterium]|nr:hypothetical protein [Treponemataceae bacterium]
MTIDDIAEALKSETAKLGFPVLMLPQAARNISTAHIQLLYRDLAENGDGGEKLLFDAEYRTAGTHARWISRTAQLRRRLHAVERSYMRLEACGVKLRAYWKSRGAPGWVYSDDSDGSMPAEYVLPYTVEIDCPSHLITEETE